MREGHGLPLHHVCPNREACWAGVPPAEQPPVAEHWDEDKSGVSIRDEFSILDPRVLVLLGRTNAAWRVRDELDEQLHREHRPGFDRFLGRLRGSPSRSSAVTTRAIRGGEPAPCDR